MSAFVDDAIKIVSSSDLMSLHQEKKNNNPQYKEIVEKLTAAEFGQLIRDVLVSWNSDMSVDGFYFVSCFSGRSRSKSHPRAGKTSWH